MRSRLNAKRPTAKLIVLACLAAWFLAKATDARSACVLGLQAKIAVDVAEGLIILPVEVNGVAAPFVLDTGAQRSVVTAAAVQRLGLLRDQWVGTTMSGVGGVTRQANADPRSLTMGGVHLARRTLNHDTSLTVGTLPRTEVAGQVIAGLLGRDYLSAFDLDLDMPDHSLTLYQPQDCFGRFLPWSGDYAGIPVTVPTESALVIPVVLDGVALRALLDTGAGSSLIGQPGMFRLRLSAASLGADPVDQLSGLGPNYVSMRRHRFHSLRIGGQTVESPLLTVAPVRLTPIVDMLLGADWLAGRRVWISYATHQVFTAAR